MLGSAALFAGLMSPRITDLKDHIEKQLQSFRNEIKAEIREMRAEFKSEFAEVKAEQRITNHRLDTLDSRFKPVAAD
jgi:hypothetical protein